MRWTPLALVMTGGVLIPALASAQVLGTAPLGTRPGASAFVLTLPSHDQRQAYLMDRIDGWHTMIAAKGDLAQDFLPEMSDLKARLSNTAEDDQLILWGFIVDAFETRLMERLDPRLPLMAPEARRQGRLALLEQKEALVALNRRRVGADSRTRREIDGIKKEIKALGFSASGLAQLYDRTRTLTGAAVSPGVSAMQGAQGPALGAAFDWGYPRPAVSVRPYGSLAIPEPGASALAESISEAQVVAIARQSGMNSAIVRQVYQESNRQGVDFRMVLAVIQAESAYNPHATSAVGARGLMQIMPATGRGLGVSSAGALYDVATNIRAGIKYLKGLWNEFSDVAWSNLGSVDPSMRRDVKAAIAAYNAGPGAVQKFGGVPPYRETRGYVAKVLDNYRKYERLF